MKNALVFFVKVSLCQKLRRKHINLDAILSRQGKFLGLASLATEQLESNFHCGEHIQHYCGGEGRANYCSIPDQMLNHLQDYLQETFERRKTSLREYNLIPQALSPSTCRVTSHLAQGIGPLPCRN